jgi:hypothetical protein
MRNEMISTTHQIGVVDMGGTWNVWGRRNNYVWRMLRNLGIKYNNNNIFINCNWVVTPWQYTFTHKQYTEQHK